jgi:hypothetical protein
MPRLLGIADPVIEYVDRVKVSMTPPLPFCYHGRGCHIRPLDEQKRKREKRQNSRKVFPLADKGFGTPFHVYRIKS